MNNEMMKQIASKYADKNLSPLRAIKVYCKEQCCCGDMESWKNCRSVSCLLYRYRLGRGNRKSQQKPGHTAPVTAQPAPSNAGVVPIPPNPGSSTASEPGCIQTKLSEVEHG